MKRFLEKRRNHLEDESGSVLILVAGMLVVMLVVTAFAIDFGQVYVVNSKVQTACDVSAMAAVSKYDPTKTGCDKTNNLAEVRKEAKRVMKVNGYTIDDSDVIINEVNQTVEVKKAVSVDTTFAKIINVNKLNTSKSAVAAVSERKKQKPFKLTYALFSGSTSDPLPVNGSTAVYGGDVHTNNGVEYNGAGSSFSIEKKLTYVNDVINPGNGTTTAGETKKTGVEPMPDYHDTIMNALPKENEYITYSDLDDYISKNSGCDVASVVTISGNVRFNNFYYTNRQLKITGNVRIDSTPEIANNVTVTEGGSLYVTSDYGMVFRGGLVSLNGYIICKGDINFQNPCMVTGITNFTQSLIYSIDKNVHFYGASNTVYGMIYAPKGEISVSAGYSIYVVNGGVIAYHVNTSQGSLTIQSNSNVAWDDKFKEDNNDGSGNGTVKTKLVK